VASPKEFGRKPERGVQRIFAAVHIERLCGDLDWVAKATKSARKYFRDRNADYESNRAAATDASLLDGRKAKQEDDEEAAPELGGGTDICAILGARSHHRQTYSYRQFCGNKTEA
jgi:hypothetical protein